MGDAQSEGKAKISREERDRLIVELRKSDKTKIEIANQLGISQSTISRVLNAAGLQANKLKPLPEDLIRERYKEHVSGLPISQLVKKYSMSDSQLRKGFKRLGLKIIDHHTLKWNPEQVYDIVQLYRSGTSNNDIAEKYQCARSVIKNILVKEGLDIRGWGQHHRLLTDEQEKQVFQLYEKGLSSNEIAKQLQDQGLDVDGRFIRSCIQKRGQGTRSIREALGGLSDEQKKLCFELYEFGANVYDIGERFGVNHGSISRYLRELNYTPRERIGNPFDTINNAIEGGGNFDIKKDCSLYVFDLAGHGNSYSKVGIAFDVDKRKDVYYGDCWLEQVFASRREAFFVEQAVLAETKSFATYPNALDDVDGASEIRNVSPADLSGIAEHFIDAIQAMDMWEFAAKYVPMTKLQLKQCLELAT